MTTKEPRIPVMELFGPTIQGEGLMTGTVTNFLRTGGCGLECVWCDSLFAVIPKEIKKHRTMMTIPQILEAMKQLPYAPYLTLTGGDPCLHKHLGDIIPAVNASTVRVAVETQGQLFPDWLKECDVITFSPKGPSSGNIVEILPLLQYMQALGTRRQSLICIKVVVFDEADFRYALDLYNMLPPMLYDAFYFTAGTPLCDPLEDTPEPTNMDRAQYMAQRVDSVVFGMQAVMRLMLASGMRFNDKTHLGCQQHVLLWPDQDKGV